MCLPLSCNFTKPEVLIFYGCGLRNGGTDFLAQKHPGFDIPAGIFQNIVINAQDIFLYQHHDGGAAELKIALLRASGHRGSTVVIDDSAHQQGAHLHHNQIAENVVLQDGIFPGVFLIDGVIIVGDGIDGVQHAGKAGVWSLAAADGVAIAMVIIHAQPENQHPAAPVCLCQLRIFQQGGQGVPGVLDGEAAALPDGVYGQAAVGGADEMPGIRVNRPEFRPDFPGKKLEKFPGCGIFSAALVNFFNKQV